MIILKEQFKAKLKQITRIAKDASIFPYLDDDLKADAQYAYEILLEIEDYIRQQEIDHFLEWNSANEIAKDLNK